MQECYMWVLNAALEEESVRVLAGPEYTLSNTVFCSMGVCTETPLPRGPPRKGWVRQGKGGGPRGLGQSWSWRQAGCCRGCTGQEGSIVAHRERSWWVLRGSSWVDEDLCLPGMHLLQPSCRSSPVHQRWSEHMKCVGSEWLCGRPDLHE